MFGITIMATSWPKFIRDPVHDLVRFDDNPMDQLLLTLINTKEFQRLRRIQQLGFSHLVFPGATHTRFAHSIGVMWNAKRVLERIRRIDASLITDEHYEVVLVGALLHDLGHGPFSHAFEKVTKTLHERRTVEILLDKDTEVHHAIAAFDKTLPVRTASLFKEGIDLIDDEQLDSYECESFLSDIVSSQLDADRWDYLIRDSHACGIGYGEFDTQWLIDHLEVDTDRGRLFLTRKAHHAVEQYIFARYHMYQTVYFHKATRAAEVMLRLLFHRYKELLDESDSEVKRMGVVPDAPSPFMKALAGEHPLEVFLQLDDHSVTEFLKAASKANDKTLVYLADGLLNRRLYKCVDATDTAQDSVGRIGEFTTAVHEMIGRRAELPVAKLATFVSDEPSDTPYKIYQPDVENPSSEIYVQRDTGQIEEVSRISDQINALKKKVTMLRYYFPPELKADVKSIANKFLKRGS